MFSSYLSFLSSPKSSYRFVKFRLFIFCIVLSACLVIFISLDYNILQACLEFTDLTFSLNRTREIKTCSPLEFDCLVFVVVLVCYLVSLVFFFSLTFVLLHLLPLFSSFASFFFTFLLLLLFLFLFLLSFLRWFLLLWSSYFSSSSSSF